MIRYKKQPNNNSVEINRSQVQMHLLLFFYLKYKKKKKRI
ncbi:hypothetical protein D920_00638 [Enterococcus faecalis 13-SD-W-01]|nr:hypothetical protein D920_00638 [Enterococcus faecalis 13-SD-W-01]